MKKIVNYLNATLLLLVLAAFSSCTVDNEGFITASEDDAPQILLPWFADWENGEPAEYKNFARDVEYIDSVTVTPTQYTKVEWFIDGEKIGEGKKIQRFFLAGNYILKIVATTTKGKTTSRTGKMVVRPLDSDPVPGNDLRDRQVVPGQKARLHGTNLNNITKITIGTQEIATSFVADGGKDYLEYVVPENLPLGTYRLTLTDAEGNVYGGDKIVISNEAPVIAEETLWEGSFAVTWGTPFNLLQTQFKDMVKAGDTVRVYVNGSGQGAMTTAWWNNILTGQGDPNRGDIVIDGATVLEYQLTQQSIDLMGTQDGMLMVGDGYTITKITKQ